MRNFFVKDSLYNIFYLCNEVKERAADFRTESAAEHVTRMEVQR